VSNPQIGALLPIRLETVFDQPGGEGSTWRLRLLIAPDEAAIDRHDPSVTEDELSTLEDLWRATGGDLSSESAGDAFRQMAARHGASRSLWLARTFPPLLDEEGRLVPDADDHVIDWDAARARARDRPPRLGTIEGFPETLEVWMALGDGSGNIISLTKIDSTTIDRSRLNAALDQADAEAAWWTSWRAARQAGLGLKIILPMTTEDELLRIEALIVVGVGDEEPAPLLADHRDSGAVAVVELGSPTAALEHAARGRRWRPRPGTGRRP
jgi:hypothetical protein